MSQKINLKQKLNQRNNNEYKIKYNSTNISQRRKIKNFIEKPINNKNPKNNILEYKNSSSNKSKRINNITNYNNKSEFLKTISENTLKLKNYYSKLNKENLNFITIKKISEWDKIESSLNLLENYDKNKDYKGIIKKNILQNFTKIKKYNHKKHNNKYFVNSMNDMIKSLLNDTIKNSRCNSTLNYKLHYLTNPSNSPVNTSGEYNKTIKGNNKSNINFNQPYLESLYLYNDNYFSNNIILSKKKYRSAYKTTKNISNYSNDNKKSIVKNYSDVFNHSFLRPSIQSIKNEKKIISKKIDKKLNKVYSNFKSGNSFLDVDRIHKNNDHKKLINLGGLELNLKKFNNFYNNYRRPVLLERDKKNKFSEKIKTVGNWDSIKYNNENVKSFSLKKFINQK